MKLSSALRNIITLCTFLQGLGAPKPCNQNMSRVNSSLLNISGEQREWCERMRAYKKLERFKNAQELEHFKKLSNKTTRILNAALKFNRELINAAENYNLAKKKILKKRVINAATPPIFFSAKEAAQEKVSKWKELVKAGKAKVLRLSTNNDQAFNLLAENVFKLCEKFEQETPSHLREHISRCLSDKTLKKTIFQAVDELLGGTSICTVDAIVRNVQRAIQAKIINSLIIKEIGEYPE